MWTPGYCTDVSGQNGVTYKASFQTTYAVPLEPTEGLCQNYSSISIWEELSGTVSYLAVDCNGVSEKQLDGFLSQVTICLRTAEVEIVISWKNSS